MGVSVCLNSSLIEKLVESFSLPLLFKLLLFLLLSDFWIGIFEFGKSKSTSGLGIFFFSFTLVNIYWSIYSVPGIRQVMSRSKAECLSVSLKWDIEWVFLVLPKCSICLSPWVILFLLWHYLSNNHARLCLCFYWFTDGLPFPKT